MSLYKALGKERLQLRVQHGKLRCTGGRAKVWICLVRKDAFLNTVAKDFGGQIKSRNFGYPGKGVDSFHQQLKDHDCQPKTVMFGMAIN